jgi:hypothetical protein
MSSELAVGPAQLVRGVEASGDVGAMLEADIA